MSETFDQQWHHAFICVTEHKMLKHHIHHKMFFCWILSGFFCYIDFEVKRDLFQAWVPLTWTNSYTKLILINVLFSWLNWVKLLCFDLSVVCLTLRTSPRLQRGWWQTPSTRPFCSVVSLLRSSLSTCSAVTMTNASLSRYERQSSHLNLVQLWAQNLEVSPKCLWEKRHLQKLMSAISFSGTSSW